MRAKSILAICFSSADCWVGSIPLGEPLLNSHAPRLAATQPADVDRTAADRGNFQIHAGWQPLFNGRDLSGWYSFLQKHGRDSDPDHLVTIDHSVIHL